MINTLKKLYLNKQLSDKLAKLDKLKLKFEKTVNNKTSNVAYNNMILLERNKFQELELSTRKQYEVINYDSLLFNEEVFKDVLDRFYREEDFSTEIQFELSNRIFQYIKLLSTEYKDMEATRILSFVKKYKDKEINEIMFMGVLRSSTNAMRKSIISLRTE